MHLNLERLRLGLSTSRSAKVAGQRYAAVALILRERKNGPEVLVIERASNANDPWSGHLAFPGGRSDDADDSLLHTAIRETLEEVGLDLRTQAHALGELAQQRTRGPGVPAMVVTPFVFALHGAPELHLAQAEVRRHFWVELTPIAQGTRDTQISIEHERIRYSFPGYTVQDRVLWGMSYKMLSSLLALAAGAAAQLGGQTADGHTD